MGVIFGNDSLIKQLSQHDTFHGRVQNFDYSVFPSTMHDWLPYTTEFLPTTYHYVTTKIAFTHSAVKNKF